MSGPARPRAPRVRRRGRTAVGSGWPPCWARRGRRAWAANTPSRGWTRTRRWPRTRPTTSSGPRAGSATAATSASRSPATSPSTSSASSSASRTAHGSRSGTTGSSVTATTSASFIRMRRAPLRVSRRQAPRVGVWTERSEVPLARLHVVEARSNPPRGDGGNAPLRAPNTRAGGDYAARSAARAERSRRRRLFRDLPECFMIPGLVAVFLLAGVPAASADDGPAGRPRSSPEAQGIPSSALLAFVNAAEAKIDALHSFMVVRHGYVVAEGWWSPYEKGDPHMLFSLSKSFTSTGIGLAAAEGRLTIDDPVLPYFPEDAPVDPSANLKAMRVRDLLAMSTGQHADDLQKFSFAGDERLTRAFLALPVAHKPGTHFLYNTPATYMLSAILQKATGTDVMDYLRPRLFEPLVIGNLSGEK